jgi:anti-sigma-K factor RskA
MIERDHTRIEELLAVRALGALDGPDEAELERLLAEHGDCAECRRLEAEFAETAAMLAASLDPVPVDPAIADRILAGEADERVAAPDALGDELAGRRGRRAGRGRGRWLVAAAAVLVLVVAGVVVTRPSQGTVTNWAQTVLQFEGDAGELSMAYDPGTPGLALWGSDLPDPGPGHTLELWRFEGETPISNGCVDPIDGNVGAFVDADVSQAQLMAVTVEADDCPSAPTTAPILTAPLPSATA